jgi:hypothetical protein
MLTVPAFVWRYGPFLRGLILGLGVGAVLAALAWLDSGFWLAGVTVFVITCAFYGLWMSRRIARNWPSAKQLRGPEREQVASSAREGHQIDDPRLASALIDYRNGLHEAAEETKQLRWLVPVVLVVAVGTAAWDAAFGSWGNAIASIIYLAMLAVEVFWWPKRRRQLLGNADRAVDLADERTE